MKKKIIIYDLGYYWMRERKRLERHYEIIACCDHKSKRKIMAGRYPFISPESINNYKYDKIIICSQLPGVREIIALKYEIPIEKISYYEEIGNDHINVDVKRSVKKLTVIIPTYNRRERLERTLKLLEMQTEQAFQVIILDNCSDYQIEDILAERGTLFREKVKIIHNRFNIGMNGNLANAFLQGVDGWIWTLADDDVPCINAIEEIYKEIERSKDAGVIFFSIMDYSGYMHNEKRDCCNLKELVQFYDEIIKTKKQRRKSQGDFIYFSNKVYDMNYIGKYIGQIILYAYSGVPQVIPILFMLNEGKRKLCISNRKIVAYDSADGDHWDWIDTFLGMRIVTDLPLDMTKKGKSTLYSIIIPDYRYLFNIINEENVSRGIDKIEVLYREVYRHFLRVYEKIDLIGRILILKIKY